MTNEGVCNQALDLIGYKRHIGSLYEGSVAARVALDCFSQTRDFFLYTTKPMWARKDETLVLTKSAPGIVNGTANYTRSWDSNTDPELPWLYEYRYPTDCVLPLQVKTTPLFLPEWRPRFESFRFNFDVDEDAHTILTNAESAILNYVAQILDPTNWHEDFTEMIVQALAQKFQAELAPELRKPNADAAS